MNISKAWLLITIIANFQPFAQSMENKLQAVSKTPQSIYTKKHALMLAGSIGFVVSTFYAAKGAYNLYK